MLRRLWPQDGPRLLLSSFERTALRAAQRRGGSDPRGLLASPATVRLGADHAGAGCATLHLDHRRIGTGKLRELAAANVPVLLYTVNDAQRARELLAAGAVSVITDIPDLLSSVASTPPGGPGS